MNSVVCPTLLFIEENDWKDNLKREYFEKKLTELIDYISNTNSKIYWNDNLGSLFWSNPNLYPWFDSNTFELSQKIFENTYNLSDSIIYSPCESNPKINCDITVIDIISPTLSLIHYLIVKKTEFAFLVDKENENTILFSCDCHKSNFTPTVISSFNLSVDINLEIEKHWNFLDTDETLYNLLKLIASKYFNNSQFLYKIEYTKKFIECLKRQKSHKNKILYAITKRLTKNQKEANQDQSLNDKPKHGSKRVRTFRVDGECRIHYTYKSNGNIFFTEYSADGEHDKKLSHTRR